MLFALSPLKPVRSLLPCHDLLEGMTEETSQETTHIFPALRISLLHQDIRVCLERCLRYNNVRHIAKTFPVILYTATRFYPPLLLTHFPAGGKSNIVPLVDRRRMLLLVLKGGHK